ncbi:hypothetical protein CTheo_2644 [Ceratobasidium theobromae]|uniref:Uncharacterized protein n=1 Tax=Ceratobasidium theobromae TaxID=1582974 RepID=A0A5N5QQM3_9AGAM|nr:hypothetical protein CTheo_2644 [Ceratobasidium theobromae]
MFPLPSVNQPHYPDSQTPNAPQNSPFLLNPLHSHATGNIRSFGLALSPELSMQAPTTPPICPRLQNKIPEEAEAHDVKGSFDYKYRSHPPINTARD